MTTADLSGSIQAFPVEKLISFLLERSSTGVLRISSSGRTSELHIRRGRIVGASSDGKRGDDALLLALIAENGTFEFASREVSESGLAYGIEDIPRLTKRAREALVAKRQPKLVEKLRGALSRSLASKEITYYSIQFRGDLAPIVSEGTGNPGRVAQKLMQFVADLDVEEDFEIELTVSNVSCIIRKIGEVCVLYLPAPVVEE